VRARERLEDAGWYDRNGNGIPDREGVELELEFLVTPGNIATQALSQKLQESFAVLGVQMRIASLDWASLQERLRSRDFDATALAWAPPLESDPEMIWHSSGARTGARSSNFAGLADPEVDRLIAKGQRELEPDTRAAIWHELHARIYSLHPFLWHYNLPVKYAISKRVHGFRAYKLDPGYRIRDWFFAQGEPGIRATLRE
jgi:peptide/nickel transport system substrate-binding protein